VHEVLNDAHSGDEDLYSSDESQGSTGEEENGNIFPNVVDEVVTQNGSDSHAPSDNESSDLALILTVLIYITQYYLSTVVVQCIPNHNVQFYDDIP